jgi:hypothetical protein
VSEPLRQPVHPGTTVEPQPVDPERELARKNNIAGFVLFLVFLALAGGTLVVALIYDSVANY